MSPAPRPKQTSQGPLVIWHFADVPTVLKLMRLGPALSWSRLHKLALLPGFAAYNSAMGAAERLLYRRAVEQTRIEHPPLFIIGHWRSGTTLLHNLLCLDRQFTYPTMYEVAFPNHFLLSERVMAPLTAPLVPKSRPMDNLPAGWDLPQEDEIALCTMTLVSPYLLLAVNETDKYEKYYALSDITPEERQRWKDAFVLFLKKLTYRKNLPVALKSPTHTYRIPLLLEMFPDAKFLYIHRHPYEVHRSTMHLRQTLVYANFLGRPDDRTWTEDVLRQSKLLFDTYERDRHLIPEGQLHEVRFDDLEEDPVGEMQRVYAELALPGFSDVLPLLEAELPKLRRYKKNAFSSLDLSTKRRIYEQQRHAFDRHDYDPEGAQVDTRPSGKRERLPA
jgi:hypothetical protein